jgi:hypothetical protein
MRSILTGISTEGVSESESESMRVSEALSELSFEELRDRRSALVRGTVPSTVLVSLTECWWRTWSVAYLINDGL